MDFKYIVFLVFLICRNVGAEENSEDTETYKMSDHVYLCSKWLSSLIDNFCNNAYKIVKRDTSLMLDKLAPKDLLKRNKKLLYTEVSRLRVRRQVASECCERPCTVGNIIMYCPEDAKLLIENPNIFD